jgi:caa(3)-type oxidase subunit IV
VEGHDLWSTESARDYHGHPNYLATWLGLVALLGVSLAAAGLGHRTLALALILGTALVKAALVAGNFMHLRWEPRALWAIGLFALLCLIFLALGVAPDIVPVPLVVAP